MNLAADSVRPQILPEVEVLTYRNRALVVVTVFPGPMRPYFLARAGREEGTYIRVGSTNRKASPEMLAELERTARNVAFDELPMPQLGTKDLDVDLARARFAGRRDLSSRDLMRLHLVVEEGRRQVPTNGGVLLFGHDRLRHFPDARLRLARFSGTTRSVIADRLDVDADPVQAIEDAMAFIRRSITTGMELEGTRRRDIPQYPPAALREAVINAVVHADYSQIGSSIRVAIYDDRIEIENPGLLPFGLTLDEVRAGISKLRNRVLGRVFHEIGLIEAWGSGIKRMTDACASMGLPAPILEELGTHFRVTLLASAAAGEPTIPGTAGRILSLLGDEAARSTSELAAVLGVTPRTVRTHVKRLVELGLVVEIGAGPTDPHRIYRRTTRSPS